MGHGTWNVEIQLANTGEEVTASARLHGPVSAVGVGSVRHDEPAQAVDQAVDQALDQAQAQAVRLALEDLGAALGYLAGAQRFANIDQA